MIISSYSWLVLTFRITSSEWPEDVSPSCTGRRAACLLQASSSRSKFQQKDVGKIIEDPGVEAMIISKRPASTFPRTKVSFIDAGMSSRASVVHAGSDVKGSMAALNGDGYKQVSGLRSNAEMGAFIRRVVRNMGMSVIDDAGFNGVVPFYSGVRATQSFDALKHEILSAPVWLKTNKSSANPDRERVASFLDPSDHFATGLITGSTATLDEKGYKSVSELKNNTEMTTFIQRVVNEMGGYITDEAGFNGVVPYYSGERATQSFVALRQEILSAPMAKKPWVKMDSEDSYDSSTQHDSKDLQTLKNGPVMGNPNGYTTGLDEDGYKAVSRLKSNFEMGLFIRKLVDDMGARIVDEAGFNGVVPFYSGQQSTQSFQALQKEIHSSAKSGNAWVVFDDKASSNHMEGDMELSIRRGAHASVDEHVSGSDAALSEKGYKEVSGLQSNAEMKKFMQRVVDDMGGHIVDESGFNGVVPYYSGVRAAQTLQAMKQEIMSTPASKNPWVELAQATRGHARTSGSTDVGGTVGSGSLSGSSAPLDEEGYEAVGSLRSNSEMKLFIERVVESLGGMIGDEDGLSGVVPYYSGERSVQSFKALKQEVLSAHWVD